MSIVTPKPIAYSNQQNQQPYSAKFLHCRYVNKDNHGNAVFQLKGGATIAYRPLFSDVVVYAIAFCRKDELYNRKRGRDEAYDRLNRHKVFSFRSSLNEFRKHLKNPDNLNELIQSYYNHYLRFYEDEVKFEHVRLWIDNKLSNLGGATIAYRRSEDTGYVEYAIGYCKPDELFNKQEGRKYAVARLRSRTERRVTSFRSLEEFRYHIATLYADNLMEQFLENYKTFAKLH